MSWSTSQTVWFLICHFLLQQISFLSSTLSAIFFVWFSQIHLILCNNFPRFLISMVSAKLITFFRSQIFWVVKLSNRLTDSWLKKTSLALEHRESISSSQFSNWVSNNPHTQHNNSAGLSPQHEHCGQPKPHIITFPYTDSSFTFKHLLFQKIFFLYIFAFLYISITNEYHSLHPTFYRRWQV